MVMRGENTRESREKGVQGLPVLFLEFLCKIKIIHYKKKKKAKVKRKYLNLAPHF